LCRKLHNDAEDYIGVPLKTATFKVALMAVFAAMQALLSMFPLSITLGVSGQVTLGLVGGCLIGVLLGPVYGGLAVLLGSFLGVFLNPGGALFGFLSPIPPFLGAFSAGCVKIKRGYVAGAVILVSLLVFYAHPYGREAFIYSWLHIVAMAVAFSPLAFMAGSAFDSVRTAKPVLGIATAAFIGAMADHMVGSALAIWYFSPSLTPEIWFLAMPVYPVERIVAVVLVTLIAAPVYYIVANTGLADLIK
jgi:biotin transporter BioY